MNVDNPHLSAVTRHVLTKRENSSTWELQGNLIHLGWTAQRTFDQEPLQQRLQHLHGLKRTRSSWNSPRSEDSIQFSNSLA